MAILGSILNGIAFFLIDSVEYRHLLYQMVQIFLIFPPKFFNFAPCYKIHFTKTTNERKIKGICPAHHRDSGVHNIERDILLPRFGGQGSRAERQHSGPRYGARNHSV